jgi:hypothetical protein
MISVQRMAELRKELGVTHLVLFSIDENGDQNVATHGRSEHQAVEASKYGNNLKKHLGFPENTCNSKPIERNCAYCDYFKNGSGFGYVEGTCYFENPTKSVHFERKACNNFLPKY